MDVFSRLMMDRIIFLGEAVYEGMANIIQAQLLFLQSADSKRDIQIYINSPGGSVYAATKSFVANFSESLWYEFKQKGVFVMGFNPGAAASDFHANAGGHTSDFPKFVMSSVEDVAEELVKALEKRRKPRVVQGWKNRFMLFGFKLLNRKSAVNIMGQLSPGMKN